MDDGETALINQISNYKADKISAWNTQAELVKTFFARAEDDGKIAADVFNAMNVHFLGGITLS